MVQIENSFLKDYSPPDEFRNELSEGDYTMPSPSVTYCYMQMGFMEVKLCDIQSGPAHSIISFGL